MVPDTSNENAAMKRRPPRETKEQKHEKDMLALASLPKKPEFFEEAVIAKNQDMLKKIYGSRFTCSSNYFKFAASKKDIHQYSISFNPPLDSNNAKYALVSSHSKLFNDTFSFDGIQFFSTTKLNDVTVVKSDFVRNVDGQKISTEYEITITYVKTLTNMKDCKQLYNIIFNRTLKSMKFVNIGEHYFDASEKNESVIDYEGDRIFIWPGFVTSISNYHNGWYLCIDPIHKIVRKDTMIDKIDNLLRSRAPYEKITQYFNEDFGGKIIMVSYGKHATYRVDGIDFTKTPMSTFVSSSGETTYVDYYKQHYGIQIRNVNHPLIFHVDTKKNLNKDPNAKIYLIPELCYITGIDDNMVKDYKLMKEMAVITKINPSVYISKCVDLVRKINSNQEAFAELNRWGITIEEKYVDLMAYQLKPPTILMGGRGNGAPVPINYDPSNPEWARNLKDNKFVVTEKTGKLVMIFSSNLTDQSRELKFTIETFLKNRNINMGIEMAPIQMARGEKNPQKFLDEIVRTAKNSAPPPFYVFILEDGNDKNLYNAIKIFCSTYGFLSQVIVGKNLRAFDEKSKKKVESIISRVILQIFAKLGSELWHIGVTNLVKNTMFIGYDVYHNTDKSKGQNRSVSGFISSTNQECTRFLSVHHLQENEISATTKTDFQNALDEYHRKNRTYPKRVIVYRDGVGDGQIKTVHDVEIKEMVDVLDDYTKTKNMPKASLIFVILQKRTNSKFLRIDKGVHHNIESGTVIFQNCTSKSNYDFFIGSQKVTQGTLVPVHYNVAYNSDTEINPHQLINITHTMTHGYVNWPGPVRVPNVCQYAHSIAYMIGTHLHGTRVNEKIMQNLYYI